MTSINNVLQEYNGTRKKKKIPKLLWNILISIVDISRETDEKYGVETIAASDGTSRRRLNEKHVEEELDQKNLLEITTIYHSDYSKHGHGLDNKFKKKTLS